MSQFQLFPSPSPQGAPKNPFRKGNRRPSIGTQSTVSSPLEDAGSKATEAKAVLFHVVEPNAIKAPPKAHISNPPRPSTPKLRVEPDLTESPQRPCLKDEKSRISPTNEFVFTSPVKDTGDTKASRRHTPVQDTASPVIPMRSIFPRFNPNAPLTQQQYYHGISNSISRTRSGPAELNLSPAPEIDRALGPKTVPASVLNFPAGVLDPVEVMYSSPAELNDLWEAANGQRPKDTSGCFNLRMARIDAATFVFGEPHVPFYTLQTYSTDELSINRSNPSKPNSGIPIMMLKLEDRRRREAPNDGLITRLFSRLAAMLAIEQAEELSRQHKLPPLEASEVETNALKRAAAQESCKLSWNHERRHYEFQHPSLSKPPALVGAAGIALSPVRSKYTGVLHISVSTPSSDPNNRQPPTILVTAPLPPDSVETAHTAATPRTSTLPLTDTDEPLASLDLGTMTLFIAADAISNTIPSLYAIDSIVGAVLAVAVSDESTNPVLGDMKLYDPNEHTSSQATVNNFQGKLVATIAEREDAQEGSRLVSKIKSVASSASIVSSGNNRWSRFWSRADKPRKLKKKSHAAQIVEEFDLEKYGRYGSGSPREGEELPGLARGLLKLLSWGLKLFIYGISLAFKIITWLLIHVARCVTSDKL